MTPAVSPSGLRVAGLLLALLAARGLPAAECVDYANYMHWVGNYSSGNYINDVAVSGDLACIAETQEFGASARFRVVDISDPSNPNELSLLELGGLSSLGIAVTGSIAYVATNTIGGVIRIVDFSNRFSPLVVGGVSGGYDVCIVGNRAYTVGPVQGTGYRLKILDITDPRHPVTLGMVPVVGKTVTVSSNHAYIGDDGFGLRIVDISNPAAPLVVGSLPLPEGGYEVAVAGSFAYVASWDDGLIAVDVSDPTQPAIAGSVAGFQCLGVAVDGQMAFVGGSLRAIDISNPQQPVVTGRVPTGLGRVILANGKAYVAGQLSGLSIVEIANATSVSSLGSLATTAPQRRVAAAEGRALLLDELGLKIVDLTGPAPALAGEVPLIGGLDLAAFGDYAVVAAGSAGVHVVDFHDPPHAAVISSLDTPFSANDLAVAGDIGYVADLTGGLRLIDLSDPFAPTEVGSAPIYSNQVAVSGDMAFVHNDASEVFRVIDVSDPTMPVPLGSLPSSWLVKDLAAAGNHLFALTFEGFTVIDVSLPTQPALVATLRMPDQLSSLAIQGQFAYINGGVASSFMHVIDVSNPAAPRHHGGAYAFQYPNDVAIGSDGLLLATDFGFYLYPHQCPLTTAVQTSAAVPSPFLRMSPNPMVGQLTARFALLAPASVSLTVYDVQGRRIRELLSGPQTSGEHVAIWDGRNDGGQRAASGVYWLRLDWSGGNSAEPVTVLR